MHAHCNLYLLTAPTFVHANMHDTPLAVEE